MTKKEEERKRGRKRQPADITADTIPRISTSNGSPGADWTSIRRTENYQSNGPVTDVSSPSMTCYELQPGTPAPETLAVTAGGSVTFGVSPNIYHAGPVDVYMAKAPGKAADFDGKGAVWFKIYGDQPTITSGGISWPSDGILPPCLFLPFPPSPSSLTHTHTLSLLSPIRKSES